LVRAGPVASRRQGGKRYKIAKNTPELDFPGKQVIIDHKSPHPPTGKRHGI
jgi:hypothetical protein